MHLFLSRAYHHWSNGTAVTISGLHDEREITRTICAGIFSYKTNKWYFCCKQPQQSPTGEVPIGDRNSMLPFALQQARSGQSISERTLEECWSTLQRVSWHLFQCVSLCSNLCGGVYLVAMVTGII
ncbi:unnamed protein product [Colias eurytheme]|nr:unnamed protein product [Colias eurytheme]